MSQNNRNKELTEFADPSQIAIFTTILIWVAESAVATLVTIFVKWLFLMIKKWWVNKVQK